jgi:hypothetical protein
MVAGQVGFFGVCGRVSLRASAFIVVAVVAALLGARSAAAAPGLMVGATDDMFKLEASTGVRLVVAV